MKSIATYNDLESHGHASKFLVLRSGLWIESLLHTSTQLLDEAAICAS